MMMRRSDFLMMSALMERNTELSGVVILLIAAYLFEHIK